MIQRLIHTLSSLPPLAKDILLLLLAFLIGLFTFRVFIDAPQMALLGDATKYNGYFVMFIKHSLVNFGQFGFWDNLSSFGTSWISNPSGYHFSPLAWITIFFFDSPITGVRFMEFSYVIFALVFFYILMRVLGVSRLAAFFISIPYIANQYLILFARNGWFEELMGIYLLPSTVLFFWLGITRKSYFFIIGGSLIMSLHFFDNSFYVFHYNSIILLWIAFTLGLHALFINRHKEKKIILKTIFTHLSLNLVFWVTFIAISAIKLIPLLEFRSLSVRNFLPLSKAEIDVMPPSILIERLMYFFIPQGHTNSFTLWANRIAVFLFILTVIYFFRKKSLVLATFLGLLMLGVWGYFANSAPLDLYGFFYHVLPGFNSNRYPYRFFVIIQFAFLVCIGLGLGALIRNRANKTLSIIGVIIGTVLVLSTVFYTSTSFSGKSLYSGFDLKKAVREADNLQVKKQFDLSNPPTINGEIPDNLLVVLAKTMNAYNPEGRVHSTVSQYLHSQNVLSNTQLLAGNLYSTQDSYDGTTLNYKYGMIPRSNEDDSPEKIKNKYKILSVLNARFQIHDRDGLDFLGCTDSGCRLSLIAKNNELSIYYDKEVLPKVTLIPNPVLLIGDNRFNDFSGFIAKQIMFHSDFDEKRITILSSKRDFEDYSIGELKNFPLIILVDPKVNNRDKFEQIKRDYQKLGRIIELESKWIEYESLHERSGSLWTDRAAWKYSDKDSKTISEIFKNLSSQNTQQGIVKIQKFTPEDLIFETETKEENVVLQFSDSYYPGWKAEVNGRKTHIYMADGLVKGVVIPEKGIHKIKMYYSPDSFKIGAGITTFTIGMLSILGFYTARKSLRKKSIKLTDIIFGVGSFIKKFHKDSMNLLQGLIRESKSFKYLIAFLVLLFFVILFSPIFLNNAASFGDLPYYWSTYLRSLSLPEIWNPHWPTGLGGNQTIILPLKFYTQIFIPPLVANLGLSWEIYHKILFASVFILLSVWTSFLLTRSWIGSLIYSTNTWILMVFSGGQMGIALSYAIIPLVLIAFQSIIKQFSLRNSLFFSLIFSIQLMFDQRMALLTLGIILILLVFKTLKNPPSVSQLQKKLFLLLIIPAAIFALNLYWVLPLLFSRIISASALSVITGESGQASFFSFAFFENSISLLHPNYPENIFGKVSFMKTEFIILPVIAFSGLLFSKAEKFRTILIYAFIALIGAFLAKGTNEPFGAIYTWLFQNIPGFSLFRDPTKFYVLVALSYTVLIPFVLNEISSEVVSFVKRFSKRSISIVLVHFLLSFVFIAFWGFTIRDSFLGNVSGIFKETRVPQEYAQLKDYLESQSDFSRTLWIPTRQRFGYFSDSHPAIDGYNLFGRISPASMTAKLANIDTIELLSNLSIKYIVVPFDNQGEIFLTDRKYDESLWQATIESLDKNRGFNKDVRFGKLRLYGTRAYNGRFYIQQSDGRAIQNLPYQRVDNAKYMVSIKDARAGDTLVFSEGYDLGWQAFSEDIKIFPIPRERLINGFVLPRDGDYSFEVYYRPQSVLGFGFVVSGVVLFLTVSILVYLKSKEIKK